MSSVRQRRKFSREFKIEAVRTVLGGDRPTTEIARELGLSPEMLYRWKKEFRDDPSQSFPGPGNLKDESKALEQLRREHARLRTENAFQKKCRGISPEASSEVWMGGHPWAPGTSQLVVCRPLGVPERLLPVAHSVAQRAGADGPSVVTGDSG